MTKKCTTIQLAPLEAKAKYSHRAYSHAIFLWQRDFGLLKDWTITCHHDSDQRDTCDVDWKIKTAVIYPMSRMMQRNGATLERYIIHEMLHILLGAITHQRFTYHVGHENGIESRLRREEQGVSDLTDMLAGGKGEI